MQQEKIASLSENEEVFFILSQQKTIDAQKEVPSGFYVRGKLADGKFNPLSNILGVGELATEGRYGWLELSSKQFYPMESDRAAMTPFVKGYMTDNGFVPSARDVYKTP